MSDDLTAPSPDLDRLLQWAASAVGSSYDLDEAEERLERSQGVYRQQQQISRESELAIEREEAAKSPEQKHAEQLSHLKDQILRLGIAFLKRWMIEIRTIVCSDKKLGEAAAGAGLAAPTVAAGLATSLASALKFDNSVAVCVAAMVIAIASTAGLRAFCSMTGDEVVEKARQVRQKLSPR